MVGLGSVEPVGAVPCGFDGATVVLEVEVLVVVKGGGATGTGGTPMR